MRLVITGGGTGGHIYPALEIARAANGAEIRYFGSLRGQEGAACASRQIPFTGFPSEPLWSLKTPAGWRALLALQRSRLMAKKVLRSDRPEVVFSTGGYSAGPIVAAARDLLIPYVIHSADSVPARSSEMFAKGAYAFTSVFKSTQRFLSSREVTRTGQPIRHALREASLGATPNPRPTVLVIGGSQGSEFLNQAVPVAAARGRLGAKVIHLSGRDHFEKTKGRAAALDLGGEYEIHPYLESDELIKAYRAASVVVARAGGTVAEIAMFGLPSVLVPLPSSARDHQLENAREIEEMDAATVLWQPEDRRRMAPPATPEALAEALTNWIEDPAKSAQASHNLREWDIPDAADRILRLIEKAANSK